MKMCVINMPVWVIELKYIRLITVKLEGFAESPPLFIQKIKENRK